MPRFSIPRGALNGAASGGSKLFQAIMGADKAYQDGYDKTALSQARIDQAQGAAAENQAQTRKYDAEAADITAKKAIREPMVRSGRYAGNRNSNQSTMSAQVCELMTSASPHALK